MKRRDYFGLLGLGLLVAVVLAILIPVPGYMDSEYYYAGGVRLFQGQGFSETFIWNYLGNPGGIPAPSHTYWMPLASIVSALGMFLARSDTFIAARIGFIGLAGLIPCLTSYLCYGLTWRRDWAWMSGCLALFSGFYITFLSNTETFSLYMLAGTAFLITSAGPVPQFFNRWPVQVRMLILGILAGIMHLSRADGVMWLPVALVIVWIISRYGIQGIQETRPEFRWLKYLSYALFILAGYALVMEPWFLRNWQTYGSLFPPGGSRALWLLGYDETFAYPASLLTFGRWQAAGWGTLIQTRWDALLKNLLTMVGVQGFVVLLPLILLGMWKLRKERIIQIGFGIWVVILGMMSVVFPFAGSRGGFFHSGAALQPLFWAVVPVGLDSAVGFGVKFRSSWDRNQANKVFGFGLILLCLVLTIGLFWLRIYGAKPREIVWRKSWDDAVQIGNKLNQLGIGSSEAVLINDPPGLYVATGRPSLVIPNGNVQAALDAANHYHVRYMVLEENHPAGLDPLYHHPGAGPGIKLVGEVGTAQIYEFQP